MVSLPSGTVAFLFTDIEGSTRLWERDAKAMRSALNRHDEILRSAIEGYGGYIFKNTGDAFCAAVSSAPEALLAGLSAQRALYSEQWGGSVIRVRMALHTEAAESKVVTTSVRPSTASRGYSPPPTAGRCCSRSLPRSWCATCCPGTRNSGISVSTA